MKQMISILSRMIAFFTIITSIYLFFIWTKICKIKNEVKELKDEIKELIKIIKEEEK